MKNADLSSTPGVARRTTAIMQPFGARGAAGSQLPATQQAPNPPSTVSLAQGPDGGITVTWTAPAIDSTHGTATGFNVQSSPSGAAAWTIVSGVLSPYNLSGLAPNAAIDVQVQSLNSGGAGAWSPTSTLTTAPAAPNTPVNVALANGPGSDLAVTWTAPAVDSTHSAATGFSLQYSPSGAGTWTNVTGVTSPYILSGLASGAAFDVQVQSVNAGGTSAWSATHTLTAASAIPNLPVGVSLGQGSGTNLTVVWTAPAVDATHAAATGFNLQSSPSGAGTWTTVTGVSSPYTVSGLAAGAAIDIRVQSTNSGGASAWSAIETLVTATPASFVPNAPVVASVAPPPDGTASTLVVTWAAPAADSSHGAATGYNLRYSPAGAGNWTTVTAVPNPYTITGLSGATSIDVEVQATNAAASPSAWSATVTGETWGATVVPGSIAVPATLVHNASTGGLNMVVAAAPTAVTGASFAWSTSASTVPTANLTAAAGDGQPNGWGAYPNTPATAGTYYLWMLAQGAGGTTIGALVTSAITVS